MSENLATVSYIGATILFILSLGGLSNQETALRGNLYGMIGMTIAVLATVMGPQVTKAGYGWIIGAMAVGAAIGIKYYGCGGSGGEGRGGWRDVVPYKFTLPSTVGVIDGPGNFINR